MHNGYSGILDAQCRNQINDQNPVQITVTKSHHRFSGTWTIWGSVGKRMGHKTALATTGTLSAVSAAMARKSMGCEHWIILLILEEVPAGWPARHSIMTAGVHDIPGCFSYSANGAVTLGFKVVGQTLERSTSPQSHPSTLPAVFSQYIVLC
jgi:hypothetical protein